MPIVEFMLHPYNDGNYVGNEIWSRVPPFIVNGESHWISPTDQTRLGYVWPEGTRAYYVPDTLNVLNKESCILRALRIHEQVPFVRTERNPEATAADIKNGRDEITVPLNENEIREMIGNWYDSMMERFGET